MTEDPASVGREPDGALGDLGTLSQEAGRVARATGLLGGLTVVSRILGLLRDVAQAAILGTGMAADAFTLAFIIPNILRRLFGESTVSAAFVPTYTETLVGASRRDAMALGNRVLTFTVTVLLLLVGVGILAAPLLVRVFAPGFAEVPGKLALTTGLLRLLFPYILMVGTASVVMGILNAHRHFLAPALAPILFNISALAGMLLLARTFFPEAPVWGYAVGVSVGGVLQLAVQLPVLRRYGFRPRPRLDWRDARMRRVGRLAFPALVGLLAAEVNILVDQMIASMLDPGSVAALSYGNRIMQFPQGVFAISMATALLPTLSRQTASGRLGDAGRTLSRATLGLAALMLPATVLLAMLSGPVVTVLLARGSFDAESVSLTSAALVYYSLGLLFYGAVKVTAPVFYAMKDTRTPVRISIACMGLNIILNVVLTRFFLATGLSRPLAGLALATSISSAVNLMLLRRRLSRRLGPRPGAGARPWLAMLPATGAVVGLLMLARPLVLESAVRGFLPGLLTLAGASAATMTLFLGLFALLGGEEARAIFAIALRRRGR